MTFGELDFGGEDASAAAAAPPSIGVDSSVSPPKSLPPAGPDVKAAATAPVSIRPAAARPGRQPGEPKKRSKARAIAAGVLVVAILGGATLQLTPYGVFGYLVIGDLVNAKAYDATTAATLAAAQKTLGSDTYDDAKSAVEATAAAHAGHPRIKPLSAIAAIVDYSTTVRFGADSARASRAKQLVFDLSATPEVRYLDVAQAAQAAEAGDNDKARKALDGVARRYPGDPILIEVALLRGNVELAAKDGAAAVAAFKQAATLGNDARAHFGLARGYDLLGDATNTKKEIDATLALSPMHPGALTLRARRQSAPVDDASALKDLTVVLDGPARVKASPSELSRAYAARAWVSLERGAASDAREAFAQAVKLDPRNVAALNGEGRLLLNEGRYTEAMARFDTAMQFDPSSPETIANDAEAKLALERLADAKQQLVDAAKRFPKSIPILLLLGKAEQHLGNLDAAEQDLRTAISFTDPARPDAVQPYVALSELLSARGHLADAKTVLDDARKRLPPSAALDRAVGEVNEAQGEYDAAIAQYKASLAKDPKDVATHFRLAVVLRRIRKFDDANAELDNVAAVDRDYPGLSLERGLLFEESGDVEKAIELFKAALAKAPDDPDLQLRVGSAYVAIDRPDDALPMLLKVLAKRSNSAEANHYIGRAKMLKGAADQAEALHYLQRAVELDPNRAEFHVYVAWAADDAQPAKLDLARDEVDKALALDKLNPEAYWQRGVLERMQGAVDDAIKDERHALQLRPARYEAHATLAECYEDKNDDATALGEWARAVAGDDASKSPDGTVPHPYWRYRYGKLLLLHGQSGAAVAQLLPATVSAEKDSGPKPGWLMLLRVPDRRGVAAGRSAQRRRRALPSGSSSSRPSARPTASTRSATSRSSAAGAEIGQRLLHPGEGVDVERLAARVERHPGDRRGLGHERRGRHAAPGVAERLASRLERALHERAEALRLRGGGRTQRQELDDGAGDLGRRVERAGRGAHQALRDERRAHEHREGAPVLGPGLRHEPARDLVLHHEHDAVHGGGVLDGHAHERARDRVRQVPAKHARRARLRGAEQRRQVHRLRVGLDDAHPFGPEVALQQRHQVAIPLHRDHRSRPRRQEPRQRARAGPDLEHAGRSHLVVVHARRRDRARDPLGHEEVLSEALLRAQAGLAEHGAGILRQGSVPVRACGSSRSGRRTSQRPCTRTPSRRSTRSPRACAECARTFTASSTKSATGLRRSRSLPTPSSKRGRLQRTSVLCRRSAAMAAPKPSLRGGAGAQTCTMLARGFSAARRASTCTIVSSALGRSPSALGGDSIPNAAR